MNGIEKARVYKIILLVEIFAIALALGEWIYIQKTDISKLPRPEVDDRSVTETYKVKGENISEDIDVEINPRMYTKEQAEDLIDKAKKEIDKEIVGENKSLDNVTKKLVLKDNYCDKKVEAEWYFDNLKVVNLDGELNYKNISKVTIVNAEVTLTCQEVSDVYEFAFVVKPMPKDSVEGVKYYITQALLEENQKNSDTFLLPVRVAGKKLVWKKKYSFLGLKLCLMGFIAYIGIIVADRYDMKRKEGDRKKELVRDYPKIVEGLSLYVGAGLSVKNAFIRIAKEAWDREKTTAGYSGICTLAKKLQDGMSEQEAYSMLPKLCDSREYRKLSAILLSNLKKGTRGLQEILEQEEIESFHMQKNTIKTQGEEASTRLIIPMIGLLGIVLMILIVPAMVSINI